jgi:hypothetical protein
MLALTETGKGVRFSIRVMPRSSKCGLAGLQGDALKIRVMEPPVEGRANEACIRFLASLFNVRKDRITIEAGQKSKNKQVLIAGLSQEDVRAALGQHAGQET